MFRVKQSGNSRAATRMARRRRYTAILRLFARAVVQTCAPSPAKEKAVPTVPVSVVVGLRPRHPLPDRAIEGGSTATL